MYIEPTTNIRLLSGVPLDNSYRNTIAFYTNAQQNSYFLSKQKYNLGNYSYVRVSNGTARVGINANDLYDCNYMMFNNINFGNKWFFAFVTDIEYINNTTSLIHFELDVMQTWFFDITYKECFVEREHPRTDDFYEHFEPENVDVGNMITLEKHQPQISDSWNMVISTAPLSNETMALKYNGEVTCTEYYWCSPTSDSVMDFLNNTLPDQSQDQIYSVYLFPSTFVGNSTGSGHLIDIGLEEPISVNMQVTMPDSINGYIPKNKKLFCSPYTVYEATDQCGNVQYYNPENFKSKILNFKIYGKYTGTPEIAMIPLSYKGETENFAESFNIQNFPMVGFATDTFRAWLAQNGTQMALQTAGNLLSTAGNMSTGNVAGVVGNAINLSSIINSAVTAYNRPNKLVTTDNSALNVSLGVKKPTLKIKCMSDSFIRQVDDYFSMFGYAINRVKIPDIYSRPHWTYIKCSNALIVGKCPSTDIARIESILNSGVTFWKNGDEVGNYSLDNSPK